MANKYWVGGAARVAQRRTFTFGGTAEADDIIRVTIGTRVYDFVTGTTVIDDALAALVTAWGALDRALFPEFYEIIPTYNSSTNVLTLTARTAGEPFFETGSTWLTLRPYEADGTTPATDLTIEGSNVATTGTALTANSSPTDGGVAANWAGGVLPVDNDTIIFQGHSVPLTCGLNYSSMDLSVRVFSNYTGTIGRPATNPLGYPEFRRTYLRIGNNGIQSVTLGIGPGAGSGRIKIDTGSVESHVVILGAGTPLDTGFPAVSIKGSHANSTFEAVKGSVGIATGPYDLGAGAEETAQYTTLAVGYLTNQNGDAQVRAGSGLTVATVNMSGGTLELNSAVSAAINKTGGELTLAGGVTGTAVVVALLNERGGTTYVTGVTTITTANIEGSGKLDYRRDMRAKVITNRVNKKSEESEFHDEFGVVATCQVDCEGCTHKNVFLGTNVSVTRSAVA